MLDRRSRNADGALLDDDSKAEDYAERTGWPILGGSVAFFLGSGVGICAVLVTGRSGVRHMDYPSSQHFRSIDDTRIANATETPLFNFDAAIEMGTEVTDSGSEEDKGVVGTIWAKWKEWYFSFWSSEIVKTCRKLRISDTCCTQIALVITSERWEIYGLIACAFLLGAFVVRWAYLVGRRIKPRPPSYWQSRSLCVWNDDYNREVDVTKELGSTVQRLMDITTDPSRMGKGMDGSWCTHKKFRVTKVIRIEKGAMWTAYALGRKAIRYVSETLALMSTDDRATAERATRLIDRSKRAWSKDKDVGSFIKALQLDDSRNETLLFHGSPGTGATDVKTGAVRFPEGATSPLEAVKEAGFDDRIGSTSGMLGSGLYFADMASKADQYAGKYGGPEQTTVGETAHMFLSRVVLGCPYLTQKSLEQMRRPPCILGHFDWGLATNNDVKFGKPWKEKGVSLQLCDHPRYDSVISDERIDGSYKLYHEYALYGRQCYPEFCVTYIREA
eukprot:TRINITY_DN3550_c0_g1_i1.p1 TRINITY_DN3550_c0_g1~~TRINITY_DN3550_c0_g1_i1.p1  ORF type:complete len:536 (-),score=76.11 TRINITY_DN3550_c0_g1_i1:183-1688(-)